MGRDRVWVACVAAGVWIASCGPAREDDTGEPREASPPVETGALGDTGDSADDTDAEDTEETADTDTSPSCIDPQPPFTYSDVAAGAFTSCALTDEGCLVCWGDDSAVRDRPASAQRYAALTVGDGMVCGLRPSGLVDCWTWYDQILANMPVDVTFAKIEAEDKSVCGVTTSGDGLCWGGLDAGFPPPTFGEPGRVADVAVNRDTLCALDIDGDVECVRKSDFGEGRWRFAGPFVDVTAGWDGPWMVGADGAVTGIRSIPDELAGGDIAAMDASELGICALRKDGTALCYDAFWDGLMSWGPVGDDHVQVAAGGAHGCALDVGCGIYCWGDDGYGQIRVP